MRLKSEYLFVLGIFAFSAVTVGYVNLAFNTTTRWAVLAIMIAVLLIWGKLFAAFRSRSGAALLLLICWTLLTGLWSEAPELSMAKGLAFAFVVIGFVSAGIAWSKVTRPEKMFSYTIPIALLAVFAALGPGASQNTSDYGNVTIYRGLSGNSNALGMLCAMGFIGALGFFIPRAIGSSTTRTKWVYWSLVVTLIAVSVSAHSRASMLIIAITFVGYAFGTGKHKQAGILLAATAAILLAALLMPDWIDYLENNLLRKGVSEEEGILYSRAEVWEDSLYQAIQGGWFGGGYGVTIGEAWPGGFTLTAIGYGREKANSQLAIWEEMGVIGLLLYGFFLLSILTAILGSFWRTRNVVLKSNLGLVLGAIAGFIAHSVFEAWWVAPGSAESPFFWGLVGVALGLTQIESAQRTKSRYSPTAYQSARTVLCVPVGER